MKIGIVVWHLDINGGTQRQALELAQNLIKMKNEVVIYTTTYDKKVCYPDICKKLKIISLDKNFDNKKNIRSNKLYNLLLNFINDRNINKIAKQLADKIDNSFDILNCHDFLTNRIGFYFKNKDRNTKLAWMLNDIPMVFLDKDRKTWGIRKYQNPNRIKNWKDLIIKFKDKIFEKYSIHKEQKFSRAFDKILVLDNRNRALVKKYLNQNSEVIRSGLDINFFSFKQKITKYSNDPFNILSAGIFFPYRRFEDTIKAVSTLNKKGYKVKFDIIGSDEYDKNYGKKLGKLVQKEELEDVVKFLGPVSDKELLRNYYKADVFVFPNHNQTWGLVVFEAMACGTPVILSQTTGAAEVLTDKKNALIIAPMNPEEIADKLEELITNKSFREELITNGKKFIDENISWELYSEKMLNFFKDLIK